MLYDSYIIHKLDSVKFTHPSFTQINFVDLRIIRLAYVPYAIIHDPFISIIIIIMLKMPNARYQSYHLSISYLFHCHTNIIRYTILLDHILPRSVHQHLYNAAIQKLKTTPKSLFSTKHLIDFLSYFSTVYFLIHLIASLATKHLNDNKSPHFNRPRQTALFTSIRRCLQQTLIHYLYPLLLRSRATNYFYNTV